MYVYVCFLTSEISTSGFVFALSFFFDSFLNLVNREVSNGVRSFDVSHLSVGPRLSRSCLNTFLSAIHLRYLLSDSESLTDGSDSDLTNLPYVLSYHSCVLPSKDVFSSV